VDKKIKPRAAIVWPYEIMELLFAYQIIEEARYRGEI